MKFASIVVAALAFALAGCASKVARVDEQSSPYTGPPIKLRAAPGPTAATRAHEATALGYVNARRNEVGLPSIQADHGVAAAAADHARYLSLNRVGTHDEVEGRPGFTGVDILTRVRLHTPAHSASEVLALFGEARSSQSPIENIFASPYHRGGLLFDWARAGEASVHGSGSVTVVDFADIARSLADNELIAWPYDNQSGVPIAWENYEQPDPMGPDSQYHGQMLGYPITLSGGPNAHIELSRVELRDAQGKKVACKIAPLTAADARRNTAICTPYEPLIKDMRYTVHAQGTLRQLWTIAHFDLSWSFNTVGDIRRANAADNRTSSY